MQESENGAQWVYAATNNQELEERYDQWATDYDKDLKEDFAWIAPQTAAKVFANLVPKSAKVLDAGAGTGLVGKVLTSPGYQDLVAIDISQGKLKEALSKPD